jgi:antitoxin (DNA-binding transcriptional repressor) of toxin-antitoxin stability system
MIRLNLSQAKARLSECVARAVSGETVVICKRNKPLAELRAIVQAPGKPRPIGLLKGSFVVPPSFFEPLADDVLDATDRKRPRGENLSGGEQ